MQPTRRAWMAAAAGAAAAAWPARASRAATPPRAPNIVFVLADDLGYGDLGCYGQRMIATPHLDRMAAEGLRFTQCYAGSTVCAPSRACLMTGFHCGHGLVRGNGDIPLRPEDTTVAEVLKRAGYATAVIGKWGLGRNGTTGAPAAKGFDEAYGYLDHLHAHNYYPDYLWRNGIKEPLAGNAPARGGQPAQRTTYSCDRFAEEAEAFIARNAARPFFLYLAYTIPHANNERHAAEGDGMETPEYGEYASRDWPNPQKGHAAMISRLDRDIGRLFGQLRTLGIDEDTIVFFSSDNGGHKEGGADPAFFQSNGPLRGHKRDLYDGGIRVPFLVRAPGRIAPGTSDLVCAFWDFLPTAAELAGAAPPPGIDGLSIAPTLLGRPGDQAQHEFLYWEFHEGTYKQAVRFGPWKAVRPAAETPIELYDVLADPGERHDLAAARADLVARAAGYFATRTPSERWPGRTA